MDARELALHLFQTTYYDSIDRGDMATAVSARTTHRSSYRRRVPQVFRPAMLVAI